MWLRASVTIYIRARTRIQTTVSLTGEGESCVDGAERELHFVAPYIILLS